VIVQPKDIICIIDGSTGFEEAGKLLISLVSTLEGLEVLKALSNEVHTLSIG
jgi:hypothetical protein